MDRKLLDYLPPVLREVMEMRAINEANEPEISIAWDALTLVLANQFLETADVRGVAVWEKELKIFPKDTDSLEGRKARIKAMWNQELPYTFPWLKRWLDGIYGPKKHREIIKDYTLHIQLDHTGLPDVSGVMPEIIKMLMEVRPCNLCLFLEGILRAQGLLGVGGAFCSIQTLPVPEAPDGMKWKGEARFGGAAAVLSVMPVPEWN